MDVSKLTLAGQINLKDISEGKKFYENFMEMTKNPIKHNEEFLLKLLDDNKDTVYGKKYDFANIKSIKEFQSKVPVTEYDDYIEYILPMSINGTKDLITSSEVDHYCKSSGTLGNPKKIPLSKAAQKSMQECTIAYFKALAANKIGLDWVDSKAMNLVELSIETLESGATYGAISAKFMFEFKDYLNELFTSPFEAFFPENDTNTRYLHARFGLMDKNIGMVQCAFYNFFLEILRYIESDWELLVNDIEKGTIDETIKMSNEIRKSLTEKIEPMPERAAELREIFKQGFDNHIVKKIWPNLAILAGTGTGGFASYAKKIKEKYTGEDVKFLYLGLNASEGNFSVAYDFETTDSIFMPNSIFYEFRPVESEDLSNLLTLDQLEHGKDYEIIITNVSGFYRYRMQDVIRITGMLNNMPKMEFLYRLNQTVNLAGEKTTEIVLRNSLNKAEKEFGFDLVEFSMYPDSDTSPPKYKFLIEALNIPTDVEKEDIRRFIQDDLSKTNPSFGDKIKKGILGEIELGYLFEETYLLYRDMMIMKGTSSAQLKPPRVIVNESQRKFFFALIDNEL
ncbi:GH3 auxin-responsive promoter [Methanobrevibacter cuticularis]|uniref:GH3 auxin-responsive promoter n=1 Tax=Methanobrevibacter cuticularis TaxID=47311 RepID=A0A166ENP3_9EURY|nr:GH3 auxin-responsive promoter family protein [Methanobrevibacter cuticularis]KZX16850.1 GH3 auxin-responsive promoter [Methanobrevibacter cuticularis]